jgi:hypothetical protein
VGSLAGVGHPNLMDHFFGTGLQMFGQLIEHVCRLVNPTALRANSREWMSLIRGVSLSKVASRNYGGVLAEAVFDETQSSISSVPND